MARLNRVKKIGLLGIIIVILFCPPLYNRYFTRDQSTEDSILLQSGPKKIAIQPKTYKNDMYLSTMYTAFIDESTEDSILLQSGRKKIAIQPKTTYTNDMYLLTMHTSFVDDPTNENRVRVQTNFLKMSNFLCFRGIVKFVVLTNSEVTTALIKRHYPNVIAHPTPLYPVFITPMYKDTHRIAMNLSKSFFYMQANACDLFETSLVQTLKAIKELWMKGFIRQKIMIYGKRFNIDVKEPVEDEFKVLEYFKKAEEFRPDSQDYIILTKETIEFNLFSEVLMGRARCDNAMVDFGVHNEVESFDGSHSIYLVHQNDYIQKYDTELLNSWENEWNHYVSEELRDHYSTTCARYSTEFGINNTVNIIDKKSKLVLNILSGEDEDFFKEHQYWIEFNTVNANVTNKTGPDLVVVVLACNKPDSLNRLLISLLNVEYEGDRIDLVISLDIGYLGFYDLPTLILIKQLLWPHGKLKLVLKNKHRGQLNQWLEAYSSVDTKDISPILILEDSLMLSPFWYEYLKAVLSKSKSIQLHERIAGWSLEAPYPGQSYTEDSSVMLANIRWVRSFVPVLNKWTSFLNWYNKESRNVPHYAFSKSPASYLDNRGNWSDWESSVWVSWYWYYLNLHSPEQQDILYIFDKRGSLAPKTRITYLNWNGYDCYREGTLESEVNFQNIDLSVKNHDIKIPEVIPTFSFEPFTSTF